MFPSYRNQSVDFQCKSTDWFLYVMGALVVKKLKNNRSIENCSLNLQLHLKRDSDRGVFL